MALITCVTDDRTYTTYFSRPPFHPATLFFEDFKVEEEYRKIAWKELKSPTLEAASDHANEDKKNKTLSTAIFDTCFDLTVVTFIFGITSIDCFWSNGVNTQWVVYFVLATIFIYASISILVKHIHVEEDRNRKRKKSIITRVSVSCCARDQTSAYLFLIF